MKARNIFLPIILSLLAHNAFAQVFQIRWSSIQDEVSSRFLEVNLRERYIPMKLDFGKSYKMTSYHAVFSNLNRSSALLPTVLELESFAELSDMNAFNARFPLQRMAKRFQDWSISEKSGILPVIPLQKKLESGRAYIVYGQSLDWNAGTTMVYIGVKKDWIDTDYFLASYRAHLDHKRKVFEPLGMDGQIVLIQDGYLVSFQHWNKAANTVTRDVYLSNNRSSETIQGVKSVVDEAYSLMNTDSHEEARPFSKLDYAYPGIVIRGMK